MYLTVSGISSLNNFLQFIGLLILFILILGATYLTAKWVGTYQLGQTKNRNIKVIETYRVSQSKFIQIIQVADKYMVVAVSKDHIEFLTELNKDEIILPTINNQNLNNGGNFKDVLHNMLNKQTKDKKNKIN